MKSEKENNRTHTHTQNYTITLDPVVSQLSKWQLQHSTPQNESWESIRQKRKTKSKSSSENKRLNVGKEKQNRLL